MLLGLDLHSTCACRFDSVMEHNLLGLGMQKEIKTGSSHMPMACRCPSRLNQKRQICDLYVVCGNKPKKRRQPVSSVCQAYSYEQLYKVLTCTMSCMNYLWCL